MHDFWEQVCERLGPSLYDFLRKNNYRPFSVDLVREFSRQLLESVACTSQSCPCPDYGLVVLRADLVVLCIGWVFSSPMKMMLSCPLVLIPVRNGMSNGDGPACRYARAHSHSHRPEAREYSFGVFRVHENARIQGEH